MMMLGVSPAHIPGSGYKSDMQYLMRECEDPVYLPQRGADVILVKDGKEQKSMCFIYYHHFL